MSDFMCQVETTWPNHNSFGEILVESLNNANKCAVAALKTLD